MATPLLLQAHEIRDSAHWYWRLTDANGHFLADHPVALDPADWHYDALLDLYGYLTRWVAPDQRQAEETRLVAEVGAWIGEQILGPIAPALVQQAPVTVRVQIPRDSPAAAGLCYLPLELAYAAGQSLALQEVSLVFEVGEPVRVQLQPVGDRLRVLAVFSLPTGESSLNLRQERYRLKNLIRQLTAARGWLALGLIASDQRVAVHTVNGRGGFVRTAGLNSGIVHPYHTVLISRSLVINRGKEATADAIGSQPALLTGLSRRHQGGGITHGY